MTRRPDYEPDATAFPHDAYTVAGWGRGIAFYVLGWELETVPNEYVTEAEEECPECKGDGEDCGNCAGLGTLENGYWTNEEGDDQRRTGQVVVTMIGDDARRIVDPSDLGPLAETAYCHGCGQIGCGHNVPDEEPT